MPTVAPRRASAAARLVLTVDLPTPPLPAATAMMFLTPGRRGFEGWLGRPTTRAVKRTSTPPTPGRLPTAVSIDRAMTVRDGQAGVVSSMPTIARSPSRATDDTIPADTKSTFRTGSCVSASTARMSSTVTDNSAFSSRRQRPQANGLVGMVPHLPPLDRQIGSVVLVLADPVGHPFGHRHARGAKARDLERVVRHQADRAHADVGQDRRRQVVAAFVRLEPERQVGLDRIRAFRLERVGTHL